MKTKTLLPCVSLLALALAAPALSAEDEAPVTDETTYESPEATTVVYDQPVTYYASVTYQAAVTYNAPVYYIAAGAAAAVAYESEYQQRAAETPASTVIVVSGGSGTYTYTKYDSENEPASQVIQFGERGGWFGPRR